MRKEVTITVVIPCYNSAATIAQCLDSIFSQKTMVDEVIIVDDGSTDESKAIIKKIFESSALPIHKKLIEQKNQGPSIARNNGVMASSSSHIAFLDSDDEWFEDHIKLHKEFLTLNDSYVVVTTKYVSAPFKYSGEVGFNQLLFRNYFLTPCVVLRKSEFIAIGGFNENMHFSEDYHLWLKLVFKRLGYVLPYIGAGNINRKRIFGDAGLSSNLRKMHLGVLQCYRTIFEAHQITWMKYVFLVMFEKLKYVRRHSLSFRSASSK